MAKQSWNGLSKMVSTEEFCGGKELISFFNNNFLVVTCALVGDSITYGNKQLNGDSGALGFDLSSTKHTIQMTEFQIPKFLDNHGYLALLYRQNEILGGII